MRIDKPLWHEGPILDRQHFQQQDRWPEFAQRQIPSAQTAALRVHNPGIRDLLRDTALLVSLLTQGGVSDPVSQLRQRCVELLATFSAALEERGFAADVREEAQYAQCGLLDEAVLRCPSIGDRSNWEANPLQVARFGKLDAGDHVFDRIEARLRESSPNIALLEFYAAVLGLGFMGRYARDGAAKRTALMATLDARLANLRPAVTRTFIVDRAARRPVDWLYRLSPWGIAAVSGIVAVLVYLASSHALDVQLGQLVASANSLKP